MAKIIREPELPMLDATNVVPIGHRDIMNLMEFPFFSIQKAPLFEPREYHHGPVTFTVQPGHKGIATIWDKDILIYVASIIAQRMNRGEPYSQLVRFHAYDFFKSCQRSTGGRAYDDLADALDRLQSTGIRTNIVVAGERGRGFSSWIKTGRMVESINPRTGNPKLGMVEVELDDWVYKQIVADQTILSIDQDYFQLSGGIARRIYEIARKHCGSQPGWSITLPNLALKVGYEEEDLKGQRNFKAALCAMIVKDDVPEYTIHLARVGDPECAPVPIEEARKSRGLKAFKCVFMRRDTRDRRKGKRAAIAETVEQSAPQPTPPAEPESTEERATADMFAELAKTLGRALRA